MKIGILTFHRHNNYGAVLQAYALQNKLNHFGQDAEIIDYDSKYLYHPMSFTCLKNKGIQGYVMGIMGWLLRFPRTLNFRKFKKEMIISSKVVRKDVGKLEAKYDMFLTGSDQVWEYEGTNFDKTYFLDFVQDSWKKNSYAACVGRKELAEEYKNEYRRLLSDYRHITVREKDGVDLLNSFLNGKAYKIGDPTFLLTKEEWKELIDIESKKQEKYILIYQSGISKELLEFSYIVAKKMGCKIKIVSVPMGKRIPCQWNLFAGPKEFLNLIYHAEYVISDSFHATALASNLNKDFYVLIPAGKVVTSSRITGLLEDLNLKERLITEYSDEFVPHKIDYELVNERIDMLRRDSLDKLQNILEE